MQVEAEKSKTEMKYVHLLQDLQAGKIASRQRKHMVIYSIFSETNVCVCGCVEGHSSYSQETVCQLLRDAMDTPEGGEQTERKQTGQL